MAWTATTATLVGAAAAVISGSLAAVAWRHRNERAAEEFLVLLLALATWSAVYAVQLGFDDLATQLVWQRLTLGVAGVVPTVWLLFALRYAGRDAWLSRRRIAVLATEPAAFMALCLTNPIHGLIWTDATRTTALGATVPALTFGVGYWLHIAYAYLIVAAGIVLLLALGNLAARMYRYQVALLIVGAIPPLFSHIAFSLGRSPIPNLDLTPFLFSFTGVVFGLALFRFNLLALTPVARIQSLREMGDGLVVVDDSDRVVDVLGVARELFDQELAIGRPVSEGIDAANLEALDGSIHTSTIGGQRRAYELRLAPVRDHHGARTGRMLMVRDVTGLRESEQRLKVSNRVLRHNLRNEIGVVLGYARTLAERLDGTDEAYATVIHETATELHELSEKARRITHLDGAINGERATVDIAAELSAVVEEFRAATTDLVIHLDVPDSLEVTMVSQETFRIAVRNVIENAVEHNDAAKPCVSATVESTDDEVRIRVADNGSGLPEMERSVIGAGLETPLEHSQGLGLWLTYWCVSMSNGSLDLDADDDGTTVTIAFPAEDAGDPAIA